MRPIAVLRLPGVARLLAAALLARLPSTAVGLLLILRVRDLGGSYALGGLAAGAFAVGLAVSSPLLGKLVDSRGQTRVLAACAVVSGAALAGLALLAPGAPDAAIVALAAVVGIAQPPVAACVRAILSTVAPNANARHAVFALEASVQEAMFIAGPLLFVSLIAARSMTDALLAAAAILLAGTVAFAAMPESRSWRPEIGVRRGIAGAIGNPGIRTILAIGACLGAALGTIEVAATAFAEDAGSRESVGLLLGVWSAGSLVGGVLAARRPAPADPAARAVGLLVVLAVTEGMLALAPGIWSLGALLALSGIALAPLLAILYGLVAAVASTGTVTEAYTWLATGLFGGVAAGAATAGIVVSTIGTSTAFVTAGLVAGLACLIARTRARTLRPVAPATAAVATLAPAAAR